MVTRRYAPAVTHIEVNLPTLHSGQIDAFNRPGRFKAIRCGRRWGKTVLLETIAGDGAARGEPIGVFAPNYKILTETYHELYEIMLPLKRSASRLDGIIRTLTDGRIDFWTLEDERAGRSRKYKKVLIDEGAFTKPNMMKIWQQSIRPTLLDLGGSATVFSNTNGIDPTNFFWRICNEPEHGFIEYHAPTHTNPHLPRDELVKLQKENHPLVYQQEYLAEFVDWSGVAFFARDDLLVDGKPVALPERCDAVFAVIDCAVKDGKEHDATAVSYWAYTRHGGYPLICLDWDLIQIEGSLLETWIPTVFQKLQEYARLCQARHGSLGAHIEDASAGTILIQQCARRGYDAKPIDTQLTSLGKDARAISVSGYVFRKMVKFCTYAWDKTSTFKNATRNHLITQVLSFRVGDPKAATRADDLADTFTYAISLALGDSGGF